MKNKARIAGVFYLITFVAGLASPALVNGRLAIDLRRNDQWGSNRISLRADHHQPFGLLRILLPPDGLPHCQVDFSSSHFRKATRMVFALR